MLPHSGATGKAISSEKQYICEPQANADQSAYETTVLSQCDDDGKIQNGIIIRTNDYDRSMP